MPFAHHGHPICRLHGRPWRDRRSTRRIAARRRALTDRTCPSSIMFGSDVGRGVDFGGPTGSAALGRDLQHPPCGQNRSRKKREIVQVEAKSANVRTIFRMVELRRGRFGRPRPGPADRPGPRPNRTRRTQHHQYRSLERLVSGPIPVTKTSCQTRTTRRSWHPKTLQLPPPPTHPSAPWARNIPHTKATPTRTRFPWRMRLGLRMHWKCAAALRKPHVAPRAEGAAPGRDNPGIRRADNQAGTPRGGLP